jgi:hypothetical protein
VLPASWAWGEKVLQETKKGALSIQTENAYPTRRKSPRLTSSRMGIRHLDLPFMAPGPTREGMGSKAEDLGRRPNNANNPEQPVDI